MQADRTALRLRDLESTNVPLPGQSLVLPCATTLPDRTVLAAEAPPPTRLRTGSASDAGSVICSFPGPIIPAWVGEMVVTAAAIPMAVPKIRVLIQVLMARLSWLSPLGADAPVSLPIASNPAARHRLYAQRAVGKIRMGRRSRHEACVPGTWKKS